MAVQSLVRPIFPSVPFGVTNTRPLPKKRNAAKAQSKAASAHRRKPAAAFRWSDAEGLLFALAALFVIGYMISAAWTHTGPFASAPAVAKSVVVTVAPGDTLWRLAGKYEAASLSGEDRLTRVRELNPNLDLSKPLVPGQHVRVPVATP